MSFITKKIVIPNGRIRAREFISWEWHGKTPARVAFMDTSFQGYCANEVVVDIGDDSDPAARGQEQIRRDGRREEEKAPLVLHEGLHDWSTRSSRT